MRELCPILKSLAEIAHERGVPLIVDEAHGAHFAFYEGEGENRQTGRLFPRSALQCGADLVIQSVHKTLPSLTQTAVLHLKEGITDRGKTGILSENLSELQSVLCDDGFD
mgnify:FL=1